MRGRIRRSDYELQQKSLSSLSELEVCQLSDIMNPFTAHTMCQDDAMRCDEITQTLTYIRCCFHIGPAFKKEEKDVCASLIRCSQECCPAVLIIIINNNYYNAMRCACMLQEDKD